MSEWLIDWVSVCGLVSGREKRCDCMECKRMELNKIEIGNFKKNRESDIP